MSKVNSKSKTVFQRVYLARSLQANKKFVTENKAERQIFGVDICWLTYCKEVLSSYKQTDESSIWHRIFDAKKVTKIATK